MKFSQLFPSAFVIALTSAVYVYFASSLNISAIWLPFISWSAYFIVGGKPSLLPKMIAGFTIGMIIGYLTIVFTGFLSGAIGSDLSLSIVVFFMTFLILLSELVKSIDMVPVYFFAYSSYFAYFYGRFDGETVMPIEILPKFWLLIMLGLGLGYFTSELRKKILI
ncbi:MAG: hypothetical protein ACD_37C00070G0003 [uncultured bacterium]|nr:MAG: hypothetical protein ACD_37C00070G0003 [uncultured bacterium]